jgi:hypothetical protein
MFTYTFEISKNDSLLAVVGIDQKNNDIGFVWYEDETLNEMLNVLVDMPQLVIMTGDSVSSSYLVMKEIISLQDDRFYDALKSQLSDYDISERAFYDEDKTLLDVLD